MSVRALEDAAPNWLAIQKEATASGSDYTMAERIFCLAVADRIRDNPTGWPSIAWIARWAGTSVSTMQRASKRPCGDGGIFLRALRPGRSGSYEYQVRPEIAERWAKGNPGQIDTGQVDTGQVERRSNRPVTPVKLTGNPGQIAYLKTNERPRKDEARASGEPSQGSQRETPREPWLVQARNAWSEGVGDAPRWFDADLRKIVNGSRPGEAVLAGLRTYLKSADLQKPGADVLRAFTQNAARWCSPAKPKAPEPEVYRGTDEQRRAKALRYGIVLP